VGRIAEEGGQPPADGRVRVDLQRRELAEEAVEKLRGTRQQLLVEALQVRELFVLFVFVCVFYRM
jgi:hypothetical protein